MNEVSEYSKWQVHFFHINTISSLLTVAVSIYLFLPHCIFRQCSIVPNKCPIMVIYKECTHLNKLCIQIVPLLLENQDKAYTYSNISRINPKWCRLFGGVLFGEMKFVLSNFLSNEDLSISYES